MRQKDKELLLQDLCARLPYKVICKIHYTFNNETTFGEDVEDEADCSLVRIDVQTQTVYLDWIYDWFSVEDVKPYLRPMSSMTEEEKTELFQLMGNGTDIQRIDFYISHHLDYRGLIPMGLALEASKDMYN